MLGKLVGAIAAITVIPAALLLSVVLFANPAAAACTTPALSASAAPNSLTATTADGTSVTLNHTQLSRAATIVDVAGQIPGVGRQGALVALMAALTESRLRLLANSTAYPDSAGYPHDGEGSDHDSLGLFQMRPSTGWGTVAQLMDPVYNAKAFFGGPTGPNYPSPRGLLDIPGWQSLDPGQAAQAVEVSAYPDRYQNYQPVAEAILTAIADSSSSAPSSGTASAGLPKATQIVFPLPEGTWVKSSPFGARTDPITGQASFHPGTDYAAPAGTPILAVAAGRVTFAGPSAGYGNLIVIEHDIDGQTVASAYGHMPTNGIHVADGELVTAGQHIADVGSEGHSTGPHLHFEIRQGGTNGTPIDSDAWLRQHDATGLAAAGSAPASCTATGAAS